MTAAVTYLVLVLQYGDAGHKCYTEILFQKGCCCTFSCALLGVPAAHTNPRPFTTLADQLLLKALSVLH